MRRKAGSGKRKAETRACPQVPSPLFGRRRLAGYRSRASRGSPGFTLIEVLVAMSIMAIGLMAVFRLQAQNLELQSEAYFMTMAGQLAKGRMAEIEVKPEEGHSSGDFRDFQPGFLYDSDVSPVSGIRDLFKIRVVITEESDRSGRRYSMETFQWVQPK